MKKVTNFSLIVKRKSTILIDVSNFFILYKRVHDYFSIDRFKNEIYSGFMFITPDIIERIASEYGQPVEESFSIPTTEKEYDRIKSSQKNGREHDVTLYIKKDDKFIVIAKHFYPPKMFRSMSGGINPGEDFESGAKREAMEETGCEIELKRFLLKTNVSFFIENDPDNREIIWHSFVFLADYVSGDFNFTDKHEIREVKLATLDDFESFKQIMLSLDLSGLHYRAALHDKVKELL